MGEVAGMMLDGTLCEGCGVYLGSDYGPAYCSSCAKDRAHVVMSVNSVDPLHGVEKQTVPFVECPVCSKRVKVTGIGDHWRHVHEVKR
jgi:Zn finger protein HypA/HybF involved in hydrogenase expression